MSTYEVFQAETTEPSNHRFALHSHNNYEILLFLEGDVKYVVEGKYYKLEPGDVMLIRLHQLHRPYHESDAVYRRIVINIGVDFFTENHCPEYEELFVREALTLDNKINAKTVKESGIYDAIMRLRAYTNGFTVPDSPVYRSSLMEILFLLRGLHSFSKAETPNSHFSMVINYVNNHFMSDVSLLSLSEKFYVSRYHLCRLFKQKTGLTFHEYLSKKRLLCVRQLVREGYSITDAALKAGFTGYDAFYRAFLKEYGVKPKDGLKGPLI